jgi:hypothetical protein
MIWVLRNLRIFEMFADKNMKELEISMETHKFYSCSKCALLCSFQSDIRIPPMYAATDASTLAMACEIVLI